MTKKISFLPEYTLSQLTDRVALKLDYFNKLFNSDNLFEGIGEPCLMVESEPRSISTLILEAKKDNNKLLSDGTLCIKSGNLLKICCSDTNNRKRFERINICL